MIHTLESFLQDSIAAGGAATDANGASSTSFPPLVFGSRDEVATVARYTTNAREPHGTGN